MNEYFKVAYLGIIEGVTEFIPVSSTGHLILSDAVLRLQSENAESFSIFIQLGAILAVVLLYWSRFQDALTLSGGEGPLSGWSGIRVYFIACLPAFVFGALFHSSIKHYLFSPATVAWALIVGGVLFIVVERLGKSREPSEQDMLVSVSARQALVIGLFQCLALWPGMSRSGSTMIGGMLAGLGRRAAAEFSFIIAVPVMVGAVGYDLLKGGQNLSAADLIYFSLGFLISFLTAMVAIRFFMRLLGHWTLVPFGVYRILLGAFVLLLIGW